MIVDILKISEDNKFVCYKCQRGEAHANIVIVNKQALSIELVVDGDPISSAGCMRKIRTSIEKDKFPEKLLLATT